MHSKSDYVDVGLRTYTAAARYEKWSEPDNNDLSELKQMYVEFAGRLASWFGVQCENSPSVVATLCVMLAFEEQLMKDINDIRCSPECYMEFGDWGPHESNTIRWFRMYAYSVLINDVMYQLSTDSTRVQEGVVGHKKMGWCKGAIRDAMLKHIGITPGELAEMCAERLPKQKLEELEVFATTLQVAKKLGVDYE